jgi:hypothetical protein
MRMDAEGILSHPWVVGEGTPMVEIPEVLEKLKVFNARRKLKKAGHLVMAANRFKNILKEKGKKSD